MSMEEKTPFLPPLSTDKLIKMAMEFYQCGEGTQTARNAVEFSRLVLKEADRLADQWKAAKLCELNGHDYEIVRPNALLEFAPLWNSKEVLHLRWSSETAIVCQKCGGRLVHQDKELL